jgi:YggT family protein
VFLISNFISASAYIIDIVLNIYMWLIIIRALLSWVNPDPHNPIVQILYRLTEPVLMPIRFRLPDFGGLDLSTMVVLIGIIFLRRFLVPSLYEFARVMR